MQAPAGIRDTVHSYLTHTEPFEMFGRSHWASIGVTLALAVALPWLARRFLGERKRVLLGVGLGIVVASGYFIRMILEGVAGTLDLTQHLPLHMCWLSCLMLPFAMTATRPTLFEIVYYWGLAGGVQGIVTPINEVEFPHFHFLYYFSGHNLLVVTLIYALAVYGVRPTWNGVGKAFLAGVALMLVCIPVNLLLDSNYFFLCRKPDVETLLNYMGPWPWYIAVGALVAFAHFALAYVPIWMLERIESRRKRAALDRNVP